jgi:hypothetical protein
VVYCVQAHLVFATATTRNNRLAIAQNAIETKPRWGDSTAVASESPDPNAIDIETRFEAKQDEQTIETQLLGLNGLVAGSWVQVHDCPHDEIRPTLCEVERRTVV